MAETIDSDIYQKVDDDIYQEVDKDSNKITQKSKIDVQEFVKAKKKLNNKLKAFESIYKFYKYIIFDEILVSLNKSLKFLEKYELIIISTINKYNSDANGYLSTHQLRMLLTIVQRFLFDKIFVNYLLPNISKYYSVSISPDIEKLIDMLRFVNANGKNLDTTDTKHVKLRNDIMSYLTNSKFIMNYNNKKKEFDYSLAKQSEDENDNFDYEFEHLTDKEKKDIKDNVSNSFINKFESLEKKFLDIQSTTLWWSILKESLIKELMNSNMDYVKSVIIFIKQMLTESIDNDYLGLERLLIKSSKKSEYSYDSNLYKLYKEHLNNINKIFEELVKNNDGKENDNTDVGIENIIADNIEKTSNEFIIDLNTEYNQIIESNSLKNNATAIYQLKKIKTKLANNFNNYISIFKSIIYAATKKSKNPTEQKISNIVSEETKVSKHDFRKIVETLVIYIKQNLLNFFNVYQNYISDLRLKYQAKLFELTDKLNDN